jgi:hypothetical protein
MQFFLAERPARWPKRRRTPVVKTTPAYTVIKTPHDDILETVYLIPHDPRTVIVAACWNNTFGDFDVTSADEVEDLVEDFPAIGQLIVNSLTQTYSEAALLQMPDLDTGDLKWFVITIVGNLNTKRPGKITRQRLAAAIDRVISASYEAVEALEHQPSTATMVMRGVWRALKRALLDSVEITLEVTIDDMVGGTATGMAPGLSNRKTFERFVSDIMAERERRSL